MAKQFKTKRGKTLLFKTAVCRKCKHTWDLPRVFERDELVDNLNSGLTLALCPKGTCRSVEVAFPYHVGNVDGVEMEPVEKPPGSGTYKSIDVSKVSAKPAQENDPNADTPVEGNRFEAPTRKSFDPSKEE